jgi:hypothetical protein
VTATACQSPQLIAMYDALDGTALGEPADACRDTPAWRVRVEHRSRHGEVAIEVQVCQWCKDNLRITPSFQWAHGLAGEKANV